MAGKVPTRIGRYRILGELGHGGMAVLYLARAIGPAGFERLFAIKTIHDQLTRERSFIDMFLDEARLAARIHHPHAVAVYDVGEADGSYYIAMDYVNGETLAHSVVRCWKQRPPFPIALAVHIAESICEALHAAHELTDARGRPLGVVHRDVSPQNIMIGYDGIARIMDFGVAKAADRLVHTRTGSQKGKVAYMAPEQIAAEPIDRRADIFALGVVLWEVLAGKRLFKGANDFATAARVKECRIPSLSKYRPEVPESLVSIVNRCLKRDPKERFSTARALGQELREFAVRENAVLAAPDVERFMKTLFPDRYAQRLEIARRATEAEDLIDAEVLIASSDGISFDDFEAASPKEKSATHPEAEVATFAPDVAAPNRTRTIVLASAVSAMAASAVFALLIPKKETVQIAPQPTAAVAAPQSIASPPPSPPPIEEVQIEVEVDPNDAITMIDGRAVDGPLVLPRSSTPVTIEVRAEGYASYTRTLIPDRSHVIAVKLEPIPVKPEKRPVRAAARSRAKRLLLEGDDL